MKGTNEGKESINESNLEGTKPNAVPFQHFLEVTKH